MKDSWTCNLCESEDSDTLISQRHIDPYYKLVNPDIQNIQMTWVKCRKCGFIFRVERLEPDESEVLYKNYRNIILAKESADQYFDRITMLPDSDSENHLRSLAFKRLIEQYVESQQKEHLDIGTGAGVFIYSFSRVNPSWRSTAVEATPAFAEIAKRKLGIEVHEGFYRGGLFNKKFQAITILQVLEHIYDPEKILMEIRADLDDGGILIIEVPSATNIGKLPPDHDVFSVPHFCLYSIDTLTDVLTRKGFKILEAEEYQLKQRGTFQVRVAATVTG